jgi:hypothetical protein
MNKAKKVLMLVIFLSFLNIFFGCQYYDLSVYEEKPVILDPADNPESPTENVNYVKIDDLNQLIEMSIMPDLKHKINNSVHNNQNNMNNASINTLSSAITQANPFSRENTDYFQRTWIYMMINEDIPLLQSWSEKAKHKLNFLVNQITQQFDVEGFEVEYNNYYLLKGTTYYIKFTKLIDLTDGIKLTFIDTDNDIEPGKFLYIEYKSYRQEEVNVSSVKFSLVAPYNKNHYISIYIKNIGDNYIQLHDITNYKDSFNNDIVAGRNFQFTFTENSFNIWRIDHWFYYSDPENSSLKEYGLSFQVYDKNDLNQAIDYNSNHFITYIPNFLIPEETITIFPDYNEIYLSPYVFKNLESYVITPGSTDFKITQLMFGGNEVKALFGDAFGVNNGTGRLVIDINNRYMAMNPEIYLQYLLDHDASFKFDLLDAYQMLIEIHQTYPEKIAFGFQPLITDEETIYNFFMSNYYTDINYINEISNNIKDINQEKYE